MDLTLTPPHLDRLADVAWTWSGPHRAFVHGCARLPASGWSVCVLESTATCQPTARSRCRKLTPRRCWGQSG